MSPARLPSPDPSLPAEPGARLVLVKHSLPLIDPFVPPSQWGLSGEGRRRCLLLAARLADVRPQLVVTSREPKAAETGRILAERLGCRCRMGSGLHEHDRSRNAPWFDDPEAFEARVADFFARPAELVFGAETADAAHDRFAAALSATLNRTPAGDLVVVTHGTVLSLLVARASGIAPFPLWRRLGMPSYVVLERATLSPCLLLTGMEAPVRPAPFVGLDGVGDA